MMENFMEENVSNRYFGFKMMFLFHLLKGKIT